MISFATVPKFFNSRAGRLGGWVLTLLGGFLAAHVLGSDWEMNRRLGESVWQQAITQAQKVFDVPILTLDQVIESQEGLVESSLGARGAKIRTGQRKRIRWSAKGAGVRTPWSLVYIHGFSAGPMELEPTISNLADRLSVNLFVTRLEAHGLTDGDDFSHVEASSWVRDVSEAVEVGKQIGENVLLVGMSTGAALALRYVSAARPSKDSALRAMILLSPNYQVQAFGSQLLENPFGRSLAKLIVGNDYHFEPKNELHRNRWTTRYSSEALHELVLVAKASRDVQTEDLEIPVLTVYVAEDNVVSISEIEKRRQRFQHPKSKTVDWETGRWHQLASEAFDSDKSGELVDLLRDWCAELNIGAGKDHNKSSH